MWTATMIARSSQFRVGRYIARMHFCLKAVGAAALLSCASIASAQTQPKYNSLLWRITGPDLPKPCYLYGTMHVSGKVAFHLSEGFFEALDESPVVALEMDPEQWLGDMSSDGWFKAFTQVGAAKGGSTDLYRDAFELEFPDRAAFTRALAKDPEVIDDLLYRMSAGNANHEEDTYLDLFIYQCATRTGKKVIGLEPMDHSVQQLLLSLTPDDDEKPDPELDRRREEYWSTVGNPDDAIEDCYRAQDLDRMDSLFDLTPNSVRSRKYVLDERNNLFLEGMLAQMRTTGLFAGVGAMHLPGENGLVEMLRRKGYTVEPVRSQVSSRSRSTQRRMESLYVPVKWRSCSPKDGAFTIDLPAPLHEISDGRSDLLMCADVANGSHFLVQRIPTYAGLRGFDQAYVMSQVDSALYEGVPGRIMRTKQATINGWPSVEVQSVDRMGRVVHLLVVVAPFEVFVFERTMRDLSQAAKDGERAFASIRFRSPENAAGRWSPSYGGCSMDLPALRHVTEPGPTMGWLPEATLERTCTVQANSPDGHDGFLHIAAFFPDASTIEQDTFELNVMAEAFAKGLGLGKPNDRSLTSDGRGILGKGVLPSGDTLRFGIFIDGSRYDLLCARATSAEAARFLGSYRREPLLQPTTLQTFRDTLLHFSVNTDCTHEDLMQHLKPFKEYFGTLWRTARLDGENAHGYMDQSIIYRSTAAPEAVHVRLEKFHRFSTIEDQDEYWERRIETITQKGKLTLRNKSEQGNEGSRSVSFVMVDTASSRTIKVLLKECPGAMYTIRTVADTAGNTSAWAKSFFGSFSTDTVFSEGAFAKKGGVLLEWINSGDSTKLEQARKSFYQAEYEDKDAPALIAYINSQEARDEEHGRRTTAIGDLGELHHPDVMPFLQRLHASAGDTTDIRFAVLEAMAEQLTRSATSTFRTYVLEDPPLTEETWRTSSLFSPFFDSLPLAKALFPGLWDLVAYPELEQPVLELAAALVDRDLLGAPDLVARKASLLSKGKAELKRAVSSARNGSSYSEYDEEDEEPASCYRNFAWNPDVPPIDDEDAIEYHIPSEVRDGLPLFSIYQRLLMPFRKDTDVQDFFRSALLSGEDATALPTTAFMLWKGMAVPDSLLRKFAVRDDSRLWTYRTLEALDRKDRFDATLLGPEKNALAYYTAGWADHKKDSLSTAGTRQVTTRYGTGTVHFFSSRVEMEEEDVQWRLGCSGFFDTNDGPPFKDKFIRMAEDNVLNKSEMEEAIDELAGELRYVGRSRWRAEERNNYGLGSGYGY